MVKQIVINDEETDLTFFPDVEYSLSACKRNLLLEHVARSCSCLYATTTTPNTSSYEHLRNCTLNDSCCIFDQYSATNSFSSCLSPCNFKLFVTSTSYSKFPKLAGFTRSSNEEDILSINVFFEDLHRVRSVTSPSYSAVQLLADIGGQLGLFIGASVISLLEIVLLFLQLWWDGAKPVAEKCAVVVHEIRYKAQHPQSADDEDKTEKEKEAESSL